jgi:pilus assembly protein CpaC
MHPFHMTRRLLLGSMAATILGLVSGTAPAQPPANPQPAPVTPKQPEAKLGKAGELIVPIGGTVRFTPRPPGFRSVQVRNPDILTAVQAEDVNSLLLTGRAPGLTQLEVIYADGKTNVYEVLVQADYELLRRVIQRAVPTATVDLIPGVGTSVILTGYVNKIEDVDVILRIAQAAVGGGAGGAPGGAPGQQSNVINAIQVGGVQHVQIEVVIAQVDRTELRTRGFDFVVNQPSAQFASLISGLITSPQTAVGTVNSPANLRLGLTSSGIFMAMQALRSEGLAKFLSEPKVVTQSGRPAIIRSGGQQAVLSNTAGGLGSISVALEQIGTTMEVLPIVYGNGRIYLEVAPSVRTVNQGNGIQTSAGFTPGFTEQSTRASVMMESGQTFAIGGLLETTVNASSSRVPVLGDIPYLGTAFSSVTHNTRETELLILVTPRLADALDCTQVPNRVPGRETRNPDDYELYLEGLLEAPRGQRQVWNGRCYNAAWKCDPSGLFPCKGNVCTGPAGAGGCLTGSCPAPAAPATAHVPVRTAQQPVADPLAPAEATIPAPPAPADGLPVPPVPGTGRQ